MIVTYTTQRPTWANAIGHEAISVVEAYYQTSKVHILIGRDYSRSRHSTVPIPTQPQKVRIVRAWRNSRYYDSNEYDLSCISMEVRDRPTMRGHSRIIQRYARMGLTINKNRGIGTWDPTLFETAGYWLSNDEPPELVPLRETTRIEIDGSDRVVMTGDVDDYIADKEDDNGYSYECIEIGTEENGQAYRIMRRVVESDISVHPYHSETREYNRRTIHPYQIGIELELTLCSAHASSAYRKLVREIECPHSENIYFESDSSLDLSHSFETITGPYYLPDICQISEGIGQAYMDSGATRTTQPTNYGLHISICCQGWSKAHKARFMRFWLSESSAMDALAGREATTYCERDNIPLPELARDYGRHEDHRCATHQQGNRIEIRCFRATGSPCVLQAKIELVHAVSQWTRDIALNNASVQNLNSLAEFVYKSRKSYPHLLNLISRVTGYEPDDRVKRSMRRKQDYPNAEIKRVYVPDVPMQNRSPLSQPVAPRTAIPHVRGEIRMTPERFHVVYPPDTDYPNWSMVGYEANMRRLVTTYPELEGHTSGDPGNTLRRFIRRPELYRALCGINAPPL